MCYFTVVNLKAKCQQHVSGLYLMMWKLAILFSWVVCAKQYVFCGFVFCGNHSSLPPHCVSFRWGQMASAERDSNSSSPRLWWCRPWALVLPDGTVLTGTPPRLSDSHIPCHSTGNQCSGSLAAKCPVPGVPASDSRSWRHTRIMPSWWDRNRLGWKWKKKGMRRCRPRSGEEAVLV